MPRPRLRPTRRPSLAASALFALVLLAAAPTPAVASIGDRAPAYRRCTAACEAIRCHPGHSTTDAAAAPPNVDDYPVKSLFWPCGDTCRYVCQHYLTDLALSATQQTPASSTLEDLPAGHQVQFHGKWPFHRLDLSSLPWFPFLPLKILTALFLPKLQEPFSVLFSFGNLYAHYRGLSTLRNLSHRGRMTEGKRLARVYETYAWSGIVAWIASVVFHSRDVDWTERADYFAAAGTMLVGLWAGVVRVKGWYSAPLLGREKPRHQRPQRRAAPLAWTVAVAAVFVLHCSYLGSLDRFNYTYNMQFNVLVALLTIALWTAWSYRQSRLPNPSNFSRRQLSSYPSARARFRAPHYLSPLLPLILLPLLTTLELLDFPPIGFGTGLRLLDAHALWHLSTIPVVWMWYRFLIKDVRWIDGQGEGGDPNSVLPAAPGSASLDTAAVAAAAAAADGASGRGSHGAGGPNGGGSSWVLERLEREGRKSSFALGGAGGGGSGADHVTSSSAATGSDTAVNGAVRRESSSSGGGGAGSTVGSAGAGKVKGVD
ncbi:hypothetical protein JCM8115_007124 [Rhodotorula mucilaginosa]|nr:hypothetical protein B0A53_06148 [Rhodotorula sp. CCFEE 5036]